MLSLNEIIVMMGIAIGDPSLPTEKPKTVGVDPIQATCLAENVYFESRNQGTAGWSAVISVTLNRVKDKRFPDTICEVVKQGPTRESWKKNGTYYPIKHKCQFSWYCDGDKDVVHEKDAKIYKDIYNLSYVSLIKGIRILDITDGATHYHADYVSPEWAQTKTKTVEIGDHIFYRWEK
jgi:spore germination cell wall hydrolase CwlJ-like protein